MGQEQQDAIIGRIVREHSESECKLKLLRTEAQEIGELFSQMGSALLRHPRNVWIEGQSTNAKAAHHPERFPADKFDIGKVVQITNDIREEMERSAHLSEDAQRLGIAL